MKLYAAAFNSIEVEKMILKGLPFAKALDELDQYKGNPKDPDLFEVEIVVRPLKKPASTRT